MRIISQDGLKDFPYDQVVLIAGMRTFEDIPVFNIIAVYNNKEYILASYSKSKYVTIIMEEIRSTPAFIPVPIESEDDDIPEFEMYNEEQVLYIKLPTEEEIARRLYGEKS